jgi:4-amino-4-deoxy-L-arabinose transferase-like glycosyltransferase
MQKAWLIIVGLILFSLFYRLGTIDLVFEEPRRALVSMEMMRTGDFLVPALHQFPYFNKPPLYNWVLAGFLKIFGWENWVVRLPTVISLILLSFFTYLFFRGKTGKKSAFYTALFTVCSVNVYFYFSFQGEIDL